MRRPRTHSENGNAWQQNNGNQYYSIINHNYGVTKSSTRQKSRISTLWQWNATDSVLTLAKCKRDDYMAWLRSRSHRLNNCIRYAPSGSLTSDFDIFRAFTFSSALLSVPLRATPSNSKFWKIHAAAIIRDERFKDQVSYDTTSSSHSERAKSFIFVSSKSSARRFDDSDEDASKAAYERLHQCQLRRHSIWLSRAYSNQMRWAGQHRSRFDVP